MVAVLETVRRRAALVTRQPPRHRRVIMAARRLVARMVDLVEEEVELQAAMGPVLSLETEAREQTLIQLG